MMPRLAPSSSVVPPDALSPEQFARLQALIEDRCGIHFDESRRVSMYASLRARMERLGLDRIDDYYERLRAQPADEEFRKLVNLVTITETCFFRDPAHFRLLRRHILPTLLAERLAGEARTIRIWSTGCSSGEEPYSIALTLWDMGVYFTHPDWRFEIVGTDVNTDVLDAARQGVYTGRALRNVEGDWLRRYFRPEEGGHFRLNEDIRQSVQFQYGNLMQQPLPRPSPESLDVIFCKNVVIYFRPEATRRLVRGLQDALRQGGYLVLGHSESLWHIADGFTLVEHEGAFCYRKAPPQPATPTRKDRARSEPARPARTATRRLRPAGSQPAAAMAPAPAPREATTGHYDGCLAAFRAGEWTEAEALLQALIQSSPTFVPAYLLLGGVYAHRGRYEEALAQAELALGLDDLEARAHLLVGMIEGRRGRQQEALQALRRALYLDDSLALAHFWLGNLYRDRGDVERACREYRHVVRGYRRHPLEMTEEFASDLSAEQLVDFCRGSVQRLRASG